MIEGAFVGLDVHRTGIQAAIRPTGEQWVSEVDDCGISEITARLLAVRPRLIVMEAQGGRELPVAGTLVTAGLPFALIAPRSVREFARAIGKTRTEAEHAAVLASFAELVQPEPRPMPNETIQLLKALAARRDELLQMLAQERNRLERDFTSVEKDVRNHMHFLEKSIAILREEINRTVRSSPIWR